MNIGIVTDTYRPRVNGVVASIDTFANEFRKLGHNVYIFAPSFPKVQEEKDLYRFPSLYLFFDPEDRLPIPWNSKIVNKISQLNLDVIHTQTPFTLGIAAIKWAKRNSIPLVHTYHTLFTSYVEHYLKFIPKKWGISWAKGFSRWYCNKCQLIITPSSQMKESVLSYGVKAPIEINPTGINMSKFQTFSGQDFRNKFGVNQDEVMLLFMGRMGREKNVDFLFRVLQRVLKVIPKTRLVVAGEGPAKADLVKLAGDMGLKNNILFLGYFSPQDWVNCYAAADLFTFASITETQGLVVTEAMAVGTPVVAVGEMGVADVMKGDKGGILTKLDEEEFTQSVLKLLADKALYATKKKEAFEWAKEWSSQSMAKRLLKYYENLK